MTSETPTAGTGSETTPAGTGTAPAGPGSPTAGRGTDPGSTLPAHPANLRHSWVFESLCDTWYNLAALGGSALVIDPCQCGH